MGLDQFFYKEKKRENEVLYFRKFWNLHDKISEILNECLENGEFYRLEPSDLIKIRDYIISDGFIDYWAFKTDDELPDNFYKTIGVLSAYSALNKPLYYNPDW